MEALQFVWLHFSLSHSAATSVSRRSLKLNEPSTLRTDRSPRVEIHVTQKQPVDEFDPTVQQLVEAGYNVNQSIEAMERYEGLEEAMDYLLSLEGEGGTFWVSMPGKEELQYPEKREVEFMEESQEERILCVFLDCHSLPTIVAKSLFFAMSTLSSFCMHLLKYDCNSLIAGDSYLYNA